RAARISASLGRDDVVDVIGLDPYDYTYTDSMQATPQSRWQDLWGRPGGIKAVLAFAHLHNKPVEFYEWGTGRAGSVWGGDSAYSVRQIARIAKDPANSVQEFFTET